MKLYSTITSERASKGQGGQYLDISIFSESEKIAELYIREYEGDIVIKYQNINNNVYQGIAKELKRIKGKRQKGETDESEKLYKQGIKTLAKINWSRL